MNNMLLLNQHMYFELAILSCDVAEATLSRLLARSAHLRRVLLLQLEGHLFEGHQLQLEGHLFDAWKEDQLQLEGHLFLLKEGHLFFLLHLRVRRVLLLLQLPGHLIFLF